MVFATAVDELKDRDGKPVEIRPEMRLSAAIFYLRTRAGWREQDAAQVSISVFGAERADVDQEREARMKALKKYTVAEKRIMRDIQARAERRAQESKSRPRR